MIEAIENKSKTCCDIVEWKIQPYISLCLYPVRYVQNQSKIQINRVYCCRKYRPSVIYYFMSFLRSLENSSVFVVSIRSFVIADRKEREIWSVARPGVRETNNCVSYLCSDAALAARLGAFAAVRGSFDGVAIIARRVARLHATGVGGQRWCSRASEVTAAFNSMTVQVVSTRTISVHLLLDLR